MNFDGSRGGATGHFTDFAGEISPPGSPPEDLRGISCIVCAYNEADRIQSILDVIVGHPALSEVIVVNDGSTDATEALLKSYPTIRLLSHSPNRGKTFALSRGIAAARHDYLMLLDADLAGVTAADIDALAAPVMRGEADVSISLRSNSLWIYRQIGLDFVSGERVAPKWLLQSAVEAMKRLPRWGGEVYMNEIFIRQGCRIGVVRWPRVINVRKYTKVGAWRGALAEAKMIADAMRVMTPLGLISQNLRLLKHVNRRTWRSRMEGFFTQRATF
ncbi:MAG TPA: glycosyltransferase family 2 protein [Caulobacteraceae bacterium]|jgi:glycosyltransferase involved in cell wall biosynthesis